MGFHILPIFAFIYLAMAGSCHASFPAEIYWNSVFPNSPIPKSLQDLLHPVNKESFGMMVKSDGRIEHSPTSFLYSVDSGYRTIYFFENDLRPGRQMKILQLAEKMDRAGFLPRRVADSMPFSSDKFLEILKRFSVESNSLEAKVMRVAIDDCESTTTEGEDKYCATSLESLIDLSVSRLGKKIRVLSSEVEKGTKTQDFTIGEGVLNMGEKQVVCHKEKYPYAVFMCHSIDKTDAYVVPLVGSDGSKAKALAICHKDTSSWNPKHRAFQQLKVKPGTVPICHFLTRETLVWVPN